MNGGKCMKRKTLKRFISTIAVGAMTLSLLAGCGGEGSQNDGNQNEAGGADTEAAGGDTQEKTVTVTLGIWPEETLTSDIEMHEGFVERMATLRPEVEYVPAYYKYATDTFMPMVESGSCPTVFETWYTEPQKLINAGAVADITDQLQERGWLDAMDPIVRDMLSDENGRVYGIPRDGYALGVMMNVELFEEAGLTDENGYPIYPKTWDELAETAKTIKEKTGAAGLCLLAKDNSGGWHFSNIAWSFGADPLCTDNGDGTFTSNLASAEAIAAMEYIKSLRWEYDVLTADPTNEDWGTGFTQLGTGNAAMYIAANDAVNQPTQNNGLAVDKLAMCAMPAGSAGQFALYGGTPYMFSASATPEEIDAALDYLAVMGRSPELTEEAIQGKEEGAANNVAAGVPVIKAFSAWNSEELLAEDARIVEEYANVDAQMFAPYFDDTDKLHPEEPGDAQQMYKELTAVMQAVLTDENADVAALMQTANDNYQQYLDNNFKAN